MVPRLIHRLWAGIRGYFWLPCPICEQMFGGHEPHGDLMTSWTDGLCVCSRCAAEAERRNAEWRTENAASWPLLEGSAA
jgi:hypothetical protein